MNKLNIFWVILLIYVVSFFLITAAEVQNTYEVEAVNYNGYLPLYTEDYLRSKDYVTVNHHYGITYYLIQSVDDRFELILMDTLIYIESATLEGYYQVEYMFISILPSGEWDFDILIGNQNYTMSGLSNYPYLEVVGFSNYEVQS